MSFKLTSSQKVLARSAAALYGEGLGSSTMASLLAGPGGLTGALNSLYEISVGDTPLVTVADVLITNLGIATGDRAAFTARVTQLESVPIAGRGKAVSDLIGSLSLETPGTSLRAAMDSWNLKVDGAVAYALSPGSVDTDFEVAARGPLKLAASKTEIDEGGAGGTVLFTLETPGSAAGTKLLWSIGGDVTGSDLLGGSTSGDATVRADGKAVVLVQTIPDAFTEGFELLTFTIQGQTVDVLVKDTSTATNGASNRPPVVTSTDKATVRENDPASLVVYTATANDPDEVDTLSWSVTGADASLLTISKTGAVTLRESANFESKASYSFNVVATDLRGAAASKAVALAVTNVNEAPAVTSGATATVAENAVASTVVYTATAIDPDAGDTRVWSLTGANASDLSISSNGAVTLKASANFETKSSYAFNVVATDKGGLTATKAVTLAVTNVNEAPTVTSGATATVAENAAASTEVYTAAAVDPDAGDSLTWSLSGADASMLSISGAGAVTLKASADFETKRAYSFNVVATDKGGLSASKAVVLTVTNVNEGPIISSSGTATVAENSAVSTVVYAATARDPEGDVFTWSIAGVDTAFLNMSAAGAVTLKSAADFEAKRAYAFEVIATDKNGLAASKGVTLSVLNVNEAPSITSSATSLSVIENEPVSTIVYAATARDPDAGDEIRWSLGGTDASFLNISAAGSVTLKLSADFETKPFYTFNVIATDKGGLSATQQAVRLNVVDVANEPQPNRAPTVTSASTSSVKENEPVSTVVYTATATDPDAGDVPTWSLGGADASMLSISPSGGLVTLKASADFETKRSYSFNVVATDKGGLTATKAVVLGVIDVVNETKNSPPTITSAATAAVKENEPVSTVVYTASATDPDAGDTRTWSLTGADASMLSISSTGAVTLKASADFETKPSYAFTVVATDKGGLTATKAVVLSVTDVFEAPAVKTVNVSAAGTTSAADGDVNIVFASGTYKHTVKDFTKGDELTFPVGAPPSLDNEDTTDGLVKFSWALDGKLVEVDVVGIPTAVDATLFGFEDFKNAFKRDLPNRAPTITSGPTGSVKENEPASTVVYTATATDPDGDTLAWSLTGADASMLSIGSTGAVTLKASADFETKPSYTFNVVATDKGGLAATKAVTLSIVDVVGVENTAPTVNSGATATVAENAAASTVVYTAIATDPDAGDTLTWSLTGGADAALLSINSATGAVTLKASADFETKPSYTFNVVATDKAGLTATKAVALAVTNVNEAPTVTSGATATVAENAAASTVVYTATATDPDAGDALTWSLSGADASMLSISSTGAVTLKASADFESKSSYAFNVVATDKSGLTANKAVTLSVTDVADAVSITAAGSVVETSASTTTFTLASVNGTYTYTITGFGAGDKIVGPTGVTPSVNNASFDDGRADLVFASGGKIVTIALGGLATAADAKLFGAADLNTVFGTGTFSSGSTGGSGGATTRAVGIESTGSETESSATNTTFTLAAVNGTYSYAISGFGAGDRIVGPTGVTPSVNNESFEDGRIELLFADAGKVITLALSGLSADADARLLAASNLDSVFGAGTFSSGSGPTTPPPTTGLITGAGTATETQATNTTFTLSSVNGTYLYTINGFGRGDKIAGPVGVVPSVDNASFDDGRVDLLYASSGKIVTIALTGISAADDALLFGVAGFSSVFGPNTLT